MVPILFLFFFLPFSSSLLSPPHNHTDDIVILPCPRDDPSFPISFLSLLPSFTSKITHLIPNKEELKIENVEDIFTCHNHTNAKLYHKDLCGEKRHIIPTPTHLIHQPYLKVPSATYNWVMDENNDFLTAKVINQLEFGVKHSEIAFNHSVIAAGRLKVEQNPSSPPTILFDLESELLTHHISCFSSTSLPLYLKKLSLFVLPHFKKFVVERGCGKKKGRRIEGVKVKYEAVPFPPTLLPLSYEEMCCHHLSYCTLHDGETSRIMQLQNIFVVGSSSATPFCHLDSFFCEKEESPWWAMLIGLVGVPIFFSVNFISLLFCGCRGNFLSSNFFPIREKEKGKGKEKGDESNGERGGFWSFWSNFLGETKEEGEKSDDNESTPLLNHQLKDLSPSIQKEDAPSRDPRINEYKNLLVCRKLRSSRDHFLHSACFTFLCFCVIFGLTELDWFENNTNKQKQTTVGTNWQHMALFFNLSLSWMAFDFFKKMMLQLHILSVAQSGGKWAPSILLLQLFSHLTLHLTIFFQFLMMLDVWFFQRIYFPGNWDLVSTRLFLYSLVISLIFSVLIFFGCNFFSSFCNLEEGRHIEGVGCMTDGLLGFPLAPTSWGQFHARGKVWYDFVNLFGFFTLFLTTLLLILWCDNGGRLVGWVVGLSGSEELTVYVLLLPLSSGPAMTITFEVYGEIPIIAPENDKLRKGWLSFVVLGSIFTVGIGLSDVLWTYHYFDPDVLDSSPLVMIVLFSFLFISLLFLEIVTMFELLPKARKTKR